MPTFARTKPPVAVSPCANPCASARANDAAISKGARERARAIQSAPQHATVPCRQQAGQVAGVSARMDRYNAALPSARAARDLNELADKNSAPVNQPCLTRLPLDAAGLNKALGINPRSPFAIRDAELRNDATGYRSALYRDESTGRYIMVSRDTDPHSLVDWKTNMDNGQGIDTAQYRSVRRLSGALSKNKVPFDIAGYSKGGGLAQEAGLVSPRSQVNVFNSAGLNNASLARTGQRSFDNLAARTHAFSAENEFLTFMNKTNDRGQDPAGELRNARFLRDQLGGPAGWGLAAWAKPLKINYLNPANKDGKDPVFQKQRDEFLRGLDDLIARKEAHPGGPPLFPPVRAGSFDTIPNSTSWMNKRLGANDPGPTLGKLAQHQMPNVVGDKSGAGPMEKQIDLDRKLLQDFRRQCG